MADLSDERRAAPCNVFQDGWCATHFEHAGRGARTCPVGRAARKAALPRLVADVNEALGGGA